MKYFRRIRIDQHATQPNITTSTYYYDIYTTADDGIPRREGIKDIHPPTKNPHTHDTVYERPEHPTVHKYHREERKRLSTMNAYGLRLCLYKIQKPQRSRDLQHQISVIIFLPTTDRYGGTAV